MNPNPRFCSQIDLRGNQVDSGFSVQSGDVRFIILRTTVLSTLSVQCQLSLCHFIVYYVLLMNIYVHVYDT